MESRSIEETMSEENKHLIELLNDMYQSQSIDFKQRYRENYFGLLEYLVNGEYIRNI